MTERDAVFLMKYVFFVHFYKTLFIFLLFLSLVNDNIKRLTTMAMRNVTLERMVCCAALVMLTLVGCKKSKTPEPADEDQQATSFYYWEESKTDNTPSATSDTKKVREKKKATFNAMEIPARMNGTAELLLKREGYFVSYNKDRKIPNWVAWHLTKAHTNGNNYRDNMEFTEDMDVPYPRATDDDYYNSRYDRGHMCPSGDNKWDRRAQMQSFLFSNICPQNHWLNKGDWNDLEIQCRYWARSIGEVYIVTGPIFYNGVRNTIGKNKVAVPDAFFKVILDDRGKSKAIGFVYPNNGKHRKMTDCIRSVDEVEKLTGIDFFPRLDDKVENIIEAASIETMNQEWQVYKARSRGNTGK